LTFRQKQVGVLEQAETTFIALPFSGERGALEELSLLRHATKEE
jgi:hypothetical protein